MDIRLANKDDSNAISAIAIALTEKYLTPELSGEALMMLISSMSPDSIIFNITNGIDYHVAMVDDEIIGLIGIKDNAHLYHLFVSDLYQRQGVATSLWETAKSRCYEKGNSEKITVNSSLYAQNVYKRLGFVAVSGVLDKNGVSTIPMEYIFSG